MAFVNEYIPQEDLIKYNFEELRKRPRKGPMRDNDWTIDREADIWLHEYYVQSDHTAPAGGYTGISGWYFYWKGTLMFLEIKSIDAAYIQGKSFRCKKKLLNINIPETLKNKSDIIFDDLEQAFNAEHGGCVYSNPQLEYHFILER